MSWMVIRRNHVCVVYFGYKNPTMIYYLLYFDVHYKFVSLMYHSADSSYRSLNLTFYLWCLKTYYEFYVTIKRTLSYGHYNNVCVVLSFHFHFSILYRYLFMLLIDWLIDCLIDWLIDPFLFIFSWTIISKTVI